MRPIPPRTVQYRDLSGWARRPGWEWRPPNTQFFAPALVYTHDAFRCYVMEQPRQQQFGWRIETKTQVIASLTGVAPSPLAGQLVVEALLPACVHALALVAENSIEPEIEL